MLWGSFTPTMKLLLAVHRPPPALVTNLCSHVVGAVTLCIITLVTRPPPHCLGAHLSYNVRIDILLHLTSEPAMGLHQQGSIYSLSSHRSPWRGKPSFHHMCRGSYRKPCEDH